MDIELINIDSPTEKTLLKVKPSPDINSKYWGFVYDGQSHPIIKLGFAPPLCVLKVAMYHDWDYSTKEKSRNLSDLYFLARLKKLGWNYRAFIWFYVIRLFGWFFYGKNKT